MEKQYFFFKLIPPRPTFPADITPEEAALMQLHSVYWEEHFAAGRILAYGPVLAPSGAFGLGILAVENEAEARRFGDNDPSVIEGLNRFEIHPMRLVASRAKG
ncbi:MAG: YciI family protein [Terracidiphilus sp.]|nr:YciI family protein [Terracidiphilus sp.]